MSGSPPEPSSDADLANDSNRGRWRPHGDHRHTAQGVAHGEVAEAVLHRVLDRGSAPRRRRRARFPPGAASRMLTVKRRPAVAFSSVREPCASETSTSSGSRETEVNELSVIRPGGDGAGPRPRRLLSRRPDDLTELPIDARHARKRTHRCELRALCAFDHHILTLYFNLSSEGAARAARPRSCLEGGCSLGAELDVTRMKSCRGLVVPRRAARRGRRRACERCSRRARASVAARKPIHAHAQAGSDSTSRSVARERRVAAQGSGYPEFEHCLRRVVFGRGRHAGRRAGRARPLWSVSSA